MFNNSGLSLNQAPPIKVVLRFFLSGSLFGMLASVLIFFYGSSLSSIASGSTLAIVHTLTLGVMASFMFGALFQMLPVIAGVHIKAPELISMRVNYALIFGTVFLIFAFFKGFNALFILAALFLSIAVFSTVFIMLKELGKIEHSNSSKGMLFALISLAVALIFALILIAFRSGADIELNYLTLKSLHYNFALFGWIALLIISVSFQVIEMFYVTPPYPKFYAKYLTVAIFSLLILELVASIFLPALFSAIEGLVKLLVAIHALFTILRLKQKKRPLTDATILFWYFGMGSYILFFLLNLFSDNSLIAAIFFTSFALSIIFAMSYKIVPFLVWFHLNAKGYFDAPMMHEIASNRYSKANLYIFIASVFFCVIAAILPFLWQFASFFIFASFFMLFLMIYNAWHKYNHTLINGKKFEMPSIK